MDILLEQRGRIDYDRIYMEWLLGALVLLLIGIALRLALRLDRNQPEAFRRKASQLDPSRESIYAGAAREIETGTAMLAISLNEAFQQRDAKREDLALRLVRLSVSEWRRVTELLEGLLNTLAAHMVRAEGLVVHSIVADRFKSSTVIQRVRLHELLDQLVFRSRLRFQLQIRILRRASEVLTTEFCRTARYLEQLRDDSVEIWGHLDFCFHDFDLVTKEALLALRALLGCIQPAALGDLAASLQSVFERGARAAIPDREAP